ncbi:hypothetical protein ASPZODRAFT_12474 [Penicilliopsis zonata CBS 506.65]|uniref:Calcium-transporting ATPase n=1 Tax=Penicilliopsis zonata CBS 506.65 TaxID=1073090 RepID=A0A1L9SX44_9EURO|nr:hypothetical protein ASPZODRAFT_12474 [Penicilliopsis zonata CBS 506.65]OJJ51661.1 hypothetical protein ASPZODRAFT_12474 [Penicilliopsis zonata CBS 506.65]
MAFTFAEEEVLSPPEHSESISGTSTLKPSTTRLTTESFLDGETLRSRSGSFNSSVNTVVRSRAGSDLPVYDGIHPSEALSPDRQYEQDFQIEDNKFAFSPGQLNKMLNPKSLAAFKALGGLPGLEKGLQTNMVAGLSVDEKQVHGRVTFDQATTPSSKGPANLTYSTSISSGSPFEDRIRVFGQNRLPARKTNGFLKLFWQAYNDKIIILLTIAAIVSLSLGIYETVSDGSGVDWIEGVAICVAILIVTTVTAANDWQKERQFSKLNKRNNDRSVKTIRSGKSCMISIFDVTVGDILHLEPGDAIPADGVLISGHGVKCDESSATGESDQMKKMSGHEVWQRLLDGTATSKLDPFLISGSKVLEGVGTYLVTSVGPYSTYGRILLSLQESDDPTPLQAKLGKLANWIGWLGAGAATVLFLALLVRFLVHLPNNSASPAAKGQEFVDILIVAVTVIVVAIPEGLPLAVTLALAFATTRMVKENNLVRVLRACETMGNATVICSDKTGTLTQNKMTVVAGTWGSDGSFHQLEEGHPASMHISGFLKNCSAAVKDLVVKSIALNSTAFEEEKDGCKQFLGSKTEVALLQLAKDYFGMDVAVERASAETVQFIPFDSSRKCMGIVYREPSMGYRLLVKGASELMLASCSAIIADTEKTGVHISQLSSERRRKVHAAIGSYANQSLRTIGMAYRDFPCWPPPNAQTLEDDPSMVRFEDILGDMTWIGVVGIQDPLRPEVPAAIQKCRAAGVQVKMVTGDNIATATAIATSCGIKTPDGLVMEGCHFRQLSDADMDEVVPRLQVLARSSPDDKRILVEKLKRIGETVAVTGDGTNDGPALRAADVGFSMGIAGTEVAKEASSIILLDDNFKSIVTAIAWGRAVNDAVSKFLQFQVTVNITAVILTFVSALSSNENESVLTAVQLLWVNLIMDTFAALALATDAPTEKILDRKPVSKNASLFTITMWKMILGQAVYQLAITFMLYFAGARLFGFDLSDAHQQRELDTIVFNTFVWMQIFNGFNNRRLDNKLNIFEGIFQNYWFLSINAIMVGGQIMIIFVGGDAFQVTPLTGLQWGVCILCAICCLPWAVVLRIVPDRHFAVVFNGVVKCINLILWPFQKSLEMTVYPVQRFTSRLRKKEQTKLYTFSDEEASVSVSMSMNLESPPAPENAVVRPPTAVPPITITPS